MKRLPWHRRLEARVLLGVTFVAGVSLLAVLIFTQQAVTRSSLDRASQDLLAAREAFNTLVTGRADLAVRQTRLIAELPTFRSLLRDSQARADVRTVDQMADAYCRKLEADFCVVTDETGAWIGRANYAETGAVHGLDREVAAARAGRAHADVATLPGGLFLIVAQPFAFDLAVESEILGTFVVGYQLDHEVAAELALVAHCDVTFLCADGRVCGSSLPVAPRAIVEAAFRTQPAALDLGADAPGLHEVGDTSYYGGVYPLSVGGGPAGSRADAGGQAKLVLLQDWTPTERAVGRIHATLLWVGAATFLVALGGGLVFSRLTTRPLRDLADVADQIAGGAWTRRLPVAGSTEARTMAEAFNRMTVTLTHWHREAASRAEQLQESYNRFRAVTNSANDAIVSVNQRGEIVFWNLRAHAVFGYEEKEAVGQSLTLIMPERYRLDYAEEMARLASRESRWLGSTVELSGLRRDGAEVPVELSLSTWTADHEQFYTAVIRDITDRRQAEEALRQREDQLRQAQKMEAVGRLAGGVAHDFNNLLTAILGYADLLRVNVPDDSQLSRDAEEIQKAGRSAASLIRDLLAFSRKQVLQPVVLDINAVVESTQNLLQRLIGEHLELHLDLDAGVGAVRADRGQLEQVLVNLVVNARDAMPTGGLLRLRTSVQVLDRSTIEPGAPVPAGPYAVLTVADNGHGMSEGTRARVFEPFFTTKAAGQGTGLGLATVYGIVKQSGGQIWVTSAPGKGSSFHVALPIINEAPAAEVSAADTQVARGSELLLLVEDNDSVRCLARETLVRAGYRVIEARNGQEALEVGGPRLQEVALVITDMMMPVMGGRELARQIRHWRPDLKVIFASGYADERVMDTGGAGDCARFLQKPFTPVALGRAVRDVLDGLPLHSS